MKKIFNILLGIGILTLSTISYTFAYTQEQRDAYQWAYKYGITTQPTIEAANLDGNLTRQAFAKMIVNYLEKAVGIQKTNSTSCTFSDENKFTNELKGYAKKTCVYEIMGSNGANFNPTNTVNRAQLGTVLSRILWGDEYNTSGKDYYIYHLNALKFNGIMNKIDNPQVYAKRGDVLIMLKRIYEKFGSNISMNGNQDSSYATPTTNININNNIITNQETTITYNEDKTISNMYSNSKVIYTGKDGTKYVYDDNFLNALMNTAKEKGEDDLYKFLEVETSYYKNGLDQIANLDMDELTESLGINDIDPDTLSTKEKEELLKKVKKGIDNLIKENKDKNEEYLNKLEKVTKNISSNDKFLLKEKYKKTKGFFDATISFLNMYSEIVFNLLELSFSSEDGEIDDGEGMAVAFGLIGTALAYQSETQSYQTYVEEWATNTIKLLGGELNTNNVNYIERKYDNLNPKISAAETRARDVSRKVDLSQIQSAIVTSLMDKGVWPGMDKGATKGISTSSIEKELMYAGMSHIPTDPVNTNINYGLGENYKTNTVKGDYLYLVAKRNGVNNGGFVVMSKQELAGSSNRVVCENKSGLDNGYITNDTDLKEVTPCKDIKQGNSCSAKACTYTNDNQLRYILIY